MNRTSLNDFIGLRGTARQRPRQLAFEPLEERRLLSANDLLVGVFSSVDGQAVERYSQTAGSLVGGGAAIDYVNNFGYTSGVAAAPDGTYYVSSLYGTVMHYTNSGIFLNDVGAGILTEPGTLAFGPNGNLYVADLGADAIYQFDLNTSTQMPVSTLELPFSPGGFTFSNDATQDLIVGDASGSGEILQYVGPSYTSSSTLLPAGTSEFGAVPNPLSLLELSNGNLLIADSTLGGDPQYHHQILEYDPTAQPPTMTQLIDLSTLVPQGDTAPQPTSLLLTPDGNLLVGFAPDRGPTDGTVEEFDLTTGDPIATIVTGIGPPAGLAYVPPLVQMTVPTSAWSGDGLTITGDSADAGGAVHVYTTNTNSDVVSAQSANVLGGIQVAGADDASNVLTIDFSGGDPIPPDGISFSGGQGSAVNSVVVSDPTATSAYTLYSSSLQLTNVPTVNLNLGGGNFDISDLSSGVSRVTLASGDFAISSGIVNADLSGPGSLMMTGPGTATLAGTNDIQGGVAVTGGTLVAASPAAMPDESTLMVGANVLTAFGANPTAAQSSSASISAVAVPAAASAAEVARSTSPTASAAPVGVAKRSVGEQAPAAALDAVLKSYNKSAVATWWNLASLPSGPRDGSANSRLAAFDAAIVEYGAR